MLSTQKIICGMVLACLTFSAQQTSAQNEKSGADAGTPTVVTGAPFSAVTYTRKVHVQPDGKSVILSEGHRMLVARDADGRIFMEGPRGKDDCDIPSLGKLPACDAWRLMLFDPGTRTMWHWLKGPKAEKTQLVQMDLRDDQIADAERETSVMETPPKDSPRDGITVQDLGEREIEGIMAKGIRTTVEVREPDGASDVRMHEVWSSARMHLALLVMDGDSMGNETISGLCKVSLVPKPSLFLAPSGLIVRHWKDSSQYATSDITALALWPVK